MTPVNILTLLILCVPYFYLITCRRVSKCELATELKKQLSEDEFNRQLGDWICGAESLSGFETSLNTTAGDNVNSRSYGMFQVNNLWWCEDDKSRTNPEGFVNRCGESCADLMDDEISNDIQCARKIVISQPPDEFKPWYSWVTHCKGKDLDQYRYLDKCPATKQPTAPIFTDESNTNFTFEEGSKIGSLFCQATALPLPQITWEYDKDQYPELRSRSILPEPGTGRLSFPEFKPFHTGEYTCIARNFFGTSKKVYYVKVTPAESESLRSSSFPYGIAIGVLLLVLLLGAVIFVYMFKRLALKLHGLTQAEIREFLYGQPEKLISSPSTTTGTVGDDGHEYENLQQDNCNNIQYMPYDHKYDIPQDKLQMSGIGAKILGEGQYGIVTKGQLEGTGSVAVKSVKPHTEKMYIKALLSELKVMVYLGIHPHIVSLIGAVVNQLDKGMLHIVIEFCEMGDLQNYLRSRKNLFIDLDDGGDNQVLIEDRLYENTSSTSECSITRNDLIKWSEQIATGMSYLAKKKVIHADLASRNVLLDHERNAKITDFGLSRRIYDYTNYVKKQQAPLPWRWMSIEALREMSFSTQSDVWSFGVTLWEIFSLGDVPYAGRSWSVDFVQELESGLRLLQPKYAPDFIYNTMLTCWNPDQYKRPTFDSLTHLND